ncbi:MAG: hypothetical protein COV59_04630 [Candidatus Magasanikbacteria bacterium CG11_big_fil_rev_8_21_14_0_20_39_34]|uniref:Uncharacterized protein n=1 Tax=Candidatus Magasanikbacteria bacterium CG11_big_fil_rev_8_21_14_0_20_39_34 TaxID=1974653 RepID=A0A2H0N4A4_9BACT|nr:MAG: hypothetical protein COV59_04630 [Candidatus Magasanikbacteria bacterium CG11_big_fil_rev_8_21_14_0_20_39_34]
MSYSAESILLKALLEGNPTIEKTQLTQGKPYVQLVFEIMSYLWSENKLPDNFFDENFDPLSCGGEGSQICQIVRVLEDLNNKIKEALSIEDSNEEGVYLHECSSQVLSQLDRALSECERKLFDLHVIEREGLLNFTNDLRDNFLYENEAKEGQEVDDGDNFPEGGESLFEYFMRPDEGAPTSVPKENAVKESTVNGVTDLDQYRKLRKGK